MLPGQAWPCAHGTQDGASASEPSVKVPGGQALHVADELLPTAADDVPARHTEHCAADEMFTAADHEPAGQGTGAGAPDVQKLPAGQAAAAAAVEPASHHAPAAHGPLQFEAERPRAPP